MSDDFEDLLVFKVMPGTGKFRCHVNVGGFDDPGAYGIILMDAMRITANSLAEHDGATDAQPYLDRILSVFDAERENYTSAVELIGREEVG